MSDVVLRASSNGQPQRRRQHLLRGRRVTLRDLLDAGLLSPGAQLEFNRPVVGEYHVATVLDDGRIQLDDGRICRSPSGAADALTGTNTDGWESWVTGKPPRRLDDLRQQLLEQALAAEVNDPRDATLAADESVVDPETRNRRRAHTFLKDARRRAEAGEPVSVRVRDLLEEWGIPARDYDGNRVIAADLENHGLRTDPAFTAVTLDTRVRLRLAQDGADVVEGAEGAEGAAGVALAEAPAAAGVRVTSAPVVRLPAVPARIDEVDRATRSFGLTLGRLPSAERGLTSVAPGDSFDRAITLMLMHDYSQLPVIDADGRLYGALNWKSIARARNVDASADLAAATFAVQPFSYDVELIRALPALTEHNFLLVCRDHADITGIVTASDVVTAYGELATPFFQIGQVDQLLRGVIDQGLPFEAVLAACGRRRRHLRSCDDMTMGDYETVLKDPDCWAALGWSLDRELFVERLAEIRKIRNKLMHFNNDSLDADTLDMFRNFIALLRGYLREEV